MIGIHRFRFNRNLEPGNLSTVPVVGDLVVGQEGEVERDISLKRLCETDCPTTGPSFHPLLIKKHLAIRVPSLGSLQDRILFLRLACREAVNMTLE